MAKKWAEDSNRFRAKAIGLRLMCGIAGIVDRFGACTADRISGMVDLLIHRGPDDRGIWISPERDVAFGHCRLSIIDLSAAGHQPMSDRTGNRHLTFNGEIYNYRELRKDLIEKGHSFLTETDSEVILAAYDEWGADFLTHLNGMFAFALYDRNTKRMILARDRAGEKPLYIRATDSGLQFASELKALIGIPGDSRSIDVDSLDEYLAYGYVAGNRCLIQGIQKLLPASALLYDCVNGTRRDWCYWNLPDETAVSGNEPELGERLELLLTNSVKQRLVADVPVGILLSGGLDSSIITALAAKATKRVKTFTISFPDDPRFNEGHYAARIASHFSTDHTDLPATAACSECLQGVVELDEPIADSSIIPSLLVSRLVRRHVTVALGGDGGDELFGGYLHYSWLLKQDRLRTILPSVFRSILRSLGRRLPTGTRGRNYLTTFAGNQKSGIASVNLLFNSLDRKRLLQREREMSVPEDRKLGICKNLTGVARSTRVDFLTYLPDDLLVKMDRASMSCALEMRAPFLDTDLIEFAFREVPDAFKCTSVSRKILLRGLARKILPDNFPLQRKQGFSIPVDRWLRNEWSVLLNDTFQSGKMELLNCAEIHKLIALQRRGFKNGGRLFALLVLRLWAQRYKITL